MSTPTNVRIYTLQILARAGRAKLSALNVKDQQDGRAQPHSDPNAPPNGEESPKKRASRACRCAEVRAALCFSALGNGGEGGSDRR